MKAARLRWGNRLATVANHADVRDELLAFDRVTIGDGSSEQTLTAREFLGLPLDERIRLNFQRALRFYRGDQRVEPQVALKSLMLAARGGE